MITIENAILDSVKLSFERGCLIPYLNFSYDRAGQSVCLVTSDFDGKKDCTAAYLKELCAVIAKNPYTSDAIKTLEKRSCRVKHTSDSILAVGHFLEDKWFVFDDFFINRF